MSWKEVLSSQDWLLWGAALFLVGISLTMFFGAAESTTVLSSRFGRQLLALGVGIVLGFVITRIPYIFWQRWSFAFYVVSVMGLVGLALAGGVIRGTVSRLEFFGFQLQPSEIAKIALVIVLSWLIAKTKQFGFKPLVTSIILAGVPVLLILFEPDAGMAFLLLVSWFGLVVFAGLSWRLILLLLSVGGVAGVASWFFVLADYQKERLSVWLDPTIDPQGAGYNVLQSIVAFGSGRLTGRGLGHGPQSQLAFLPERHTDFILASIGEELGFIGICLVLFLYGILLWRVYVAGRTTKDAFGQAVAVGVFLVLLVSLVISAGMNLGLLPVTGLPLPLLSYGGSNLVATFVLLGVVQSITVNNKWVQERPLEISHF